MVDEQSRRIWEELAEITERLRRFERDMGYGPGGPMDPGYGPAWRYDDDMPDDLRAVFERMEEDRLYEEDAPYDPEHPDPKLAQRVLADYMTTTGKTINPLVKTAIGTACLDIYLARKAIRERGFIDLSSKSGRELYQRRRLTDIEIVNRIEPEEFEEFPPLANLLRDVQQAYGHIRITDV